MIHDAKVEVTCDGEGCWDSVEVELEYRYNNYSGNSGQYNDDDSAIEKSLESDHEWIVQDGEHFCSEECAGLVEDDE